MTSSPSPIFTSLAIVGLSVATLFGAFKLKTLWEHVQRDWTAATATQKQTAQELEALRQSLKEKEAEVQERAEVAASREKEIEELLTQARQKLGAHADRLQVVFVSVDPERDTPARLKTYLAQFDKSFIGLTGTPEQMAAIRKDYGINATKVPTGPDSYQMGHSSYLYFVDKKGMLRALMPFGRPADEIVHDVNVLAAE